MYNEDSKDEVKVRQKRGVFMMLPLILTNSGVKVVIPPLPFPEISPLGGRILRFIMTNQCHGFIICESRRNGSNIFGFVLFFVVLTSVSYFLAAYFTCTSWGERMKHTGKGQMTFMPGHFSDQRRRKHREEWERTLEVPTARRQL